MSVEIKEVIYLKLKSLIQWKIKRDEGLEIATLAGGCFWCTEAVFLQLEGVHAVISGYIAN
jgi:peptide-methionine (S)-S-oxide reductase